MDITVVPNTLEPNYEFGGRNADQLALANILALDKGIGGRKLLSISGVPLNASSSLELSVLRPLVFYHLYHYLVWLGPHMLRHYLLFVMLPP